jgi:hypothetical protein
MKGKNLPLAVHYRFGAHAESFDHQTAFRRTVAVGNDGSSGLPRANDNRKGTDGGNVRLIESRDRIKPP